jgi:hypothetical protein
MTWYRRYTLMNFEFNAAGSLPKRSHLDVKRCCLNRSGCRPTSRCQVPTLSTQTLESFSLAIKTFLWPEVRQSADHRRRFVFTITACTILRTIVLMCIGHLPVNRQIAYKREVRRTRMRSVGGRTYLIGEPRYPMVGQLERFPPCL